MDTFMSLITEPFREMYHSLRAFLPNLLAMATIIVIGTGLGLVLRSVMRKVLAAAKFDSWCDRMGLTAVMRRGSAWGKPSQTLAGLIFWVFIFVTVMLGLSVLKVESIDMLIGNAFLYLPRAFSAVLILFFGYFVTGLLSRGVLIAAVNSGYQYSRLLAEAVRLLLTVLFLAMALEQLQVAPSIVIAAFSIMFGGIVVALAIAFGVGGIQAARKIIEKEAAAKAAPEREDTDHL